LPQELEQIMPMIRGCMENDRNCQRELYQWLADYAMKIAYRYVSRTEEAEELVSESFVKLFRNIGQFNGNREGDPAALLKGWFKKIVINTCIDHLRKSHLKLIGMDMGQEQEISDAGQESGLDKLSYDEILEAIRQLTPVYRTVFNLFVIEGLSHEEISILLGISIGASKSNLSKAKHNLRNIILQRTQYKQYA